MTLSFEVLTVLMVLLPGFLCAKIIQWLCVRPEQTEMDKLVEALLFSFVIYVAFTAMFGEVQLSRKHVVYLAVLSVGISVIGSALWTNDWLGWLLRKARVTQRTSHPSVWNDVFHHYGGYVLVELKDGRLVLGWVRYFSDHESAPTLFLEDAAWVHQNGERTQILGAGILITADYGIKTIAFHNAVDMNKSVKTIEASPTLLSSANATEAEGTQTT
jgi:hypothetical protein